MAYPSARLRPSRNVWGTGFGRVYNVTSPPKQATISPDYQSDGFASAACRAYLGAAKRVPFMSAAEQIEDVSGAKPTRRDALLEEEAFIEARLTQSPAKTGAKLRPLLALAPYIARYRGRALLAFVSLTIAAMTTLVVPIAARRMIDFGFSPEGIAMINNYFSVMLAVVAVLAGGSAARVYLAGATAARSSLVMTIGERIVADIRRDVFAHLISLSPAFFDSARSGE